MRIWSLTLAYENKSLEMRFLGNLYTKRAGGEKVAARKEPQEMCKKNQETASSQVSRHFKGQEAKGSEKHQGMKNKKMTLNLTAWRVDFRRVASAEQVMKVKGTKEKMHSGKLIIHDC